MSLFDKQALPGCICFTLLLLYHLFWAFLKPPLQAPDEMAHLIKSYSVTRAPWLATELLVDVDPALANPLIDQISLNVIPFHPENRFTRAELKRLKEIPWSVAKLAVPGKQETPAHSYPNGYYLPAFVLGQGMTSVFSLSPYQSVYAYRVGTALLASLLWLLVRNKLRSLDELPQSYRSVFLVLILNPMSGFISSAVSPDAIFNPLVTLATLESYRLIRERGAFLPAVMYLLLALFTKPTALVLLPALLAAALVLYLFRFINGRCVLRIVGATSGSGLVATALFYLWSTPALYGNPVEFSLFRYLGNIAKRRIFGFFEGYWGVLGWLDYRLPHLFYAVLGLLLVANGAVVLRRSVSGTDARGGIVSFAALTSLFFFLALLAGEFRTLSTVGFLIQGRYLLAVALGVSMVVAHPLRWLRNAVLLWLVVMNVAFVPRTVERYYSGDWGCVVESLPY